MATRKRSNGIPRLYIKKGDSLKTIYAKAKKAFTAADLAKYAEIEEGIPLRDVIGRMEEIEREQASNRAAKKSKKKLPAHHDRW